MTRPPLPSQITVADAHREPGLRDPAASLAARLDLFAEIASGDLEPIGQHLSFEANYFGQDRCGPGGRCDRCGVAPRTSIGDIIAPLLKDPQ